MNKKRTFSISFFNTFFSLVFFAFTVIVIILWSYTNTNRTLELNIKDYFNQTNNIAKIIIEQEQKELFNLSYDISEKSKTFKNIKEMKQVISNITVLSEIDLIFFQDNKKTINFSNSLFDTDIMMNKILELKTRQNSSIVSVKIDNQEYVILLNQEKIIDKKTGRVLRRLYLGKILNDNFLIMDNIRSKSQVQDLLIFHNEKLITTTIKNNTLKIGYMKENEIIKKGQLIISKKSLDIENNEKISFIFVIKNSIFGDIQSDYLEQIYFLVFLLIIVLFGLHTLAQNMFINPFEKLLKFANHLKEGKKIEYKPSRISEFNDFSQDIQSIILELRDMKEQYSLAIEGVQDGLWDTDLTTKKTFFSDRYKLMLGYDIADKLDNANFWRESLYPADYRKTLKKLSSHLKGLTKIYEDDYRIKCKDGNYKWIKIRGKAFFNDEGIAYRMTGFHTDIDEFILLQQDNLQKEKMLHDQSKHAAMGEMIANIAHQWRQPLSVILTLSTSLQLNIEMNTIKKESIDSELEKINNTVDYLSQIIEKFRNFFNPNKELEYFSIKKIILDNLEIFETSYKNHNINIELDLQNIEIFGYRIELIQVIVNLINNAKDALVERDIKERFIFIKCYSKKSKAVIEVYDNAGGISTEVSQSIYDPYFTTKHKSQGTGLGLFMSQEIIKKHFNGKLYNNNYDYRYDNKHFHGEKFTIELDLKPQNELTNISKKK